MKKIIILLFIAAAFLTMGFASMRMDLRMGGSAGYGIVYDPGDALLLETADYLLLETDDKLLLE